MLRRRRTAFRIPAIAVTATAPLLALSASPAFAQDAVRQTINAAQIVLLAALIGVVSFAVIAALTLIRARNRAETENGQLKAEIASLKARADRAESLLGAEDRRLVIWDAPGAAATVVGELPRQSGVPADRARFLAFGSWLTIGAATALERAVTRLRERGEPFVLNLTGQQVPFVEASGRTVGGRAVVRFRDLSGDRLALADLEGRHAAALAELAVVKALLDAVPLPAWIRDTTDRPVWVNRAYAAAVEAADRAAAVADGTDLLDTAAREAIAAAHAQDPVFRRRLSAVSAGQRVVYDVTDVIAEGGRAGIAVDVTEIEESHSALRRLIEFHTRTLDQLATAVAIFGADRRLQSYNAAYRELFGLDAAFLDTLPDEIAILDRLRATRKVPDQADFRVWRADLLSAYQSPETREHLWRLPEGQTLRVIANPHPQGGMTWIYENVTARLDLESRYNSLIRIQGETLDHLREGVAVFGSDGRLRLHNPAFLAIWGVDAGRLGERPHVSQLVAACAALSGGPEAWHTLTAAIAGVDESRGSVSGRMELADGRVVDYATVPLPEGQTMATFVEVTDSVHVERALVERNDALEAADRLKNAFIQKVSYELRSPLTNIIGFTQLLADAGIGPLNGKQREYVGYIMTSSGSLLAIINDILDLATIDAGIMTLDLTEVDLRATVAAAIEGLRDRLTETGVRLESRVDPAIGPMIADEKRLRQILYNLLANAIGFSSQGGRVVVSARRDQGDVVLMVQDEGAGIPDDFLGAVFNRFEARGEGGARSGPGLGLSIVKSFVELHGGTIAIDSAPGRGTRVTVRLPLRPEEPVPVAAE
ncbi:MAG: PAS-domain containing protein [Bauldia sp.]|nr:PAS-domain containing protein [Bauldia sp.]